MGKRLIRIHHAALKSKVAAFHNKEGDVVLFSGETFHGQIVEEKDTLLILIDKRFNKHEILYSAIEEIIIDFEAPH